jgi:methylated-DNA-[protein]-cysteine S-methyltransferase
MSSFVSILHTPIGSLIIEADERVVCYIGFKNEVPEALPNDITEIAKQQLYEYFEGERSSFDFPFAQPGTDFQQRVWKELAQIPPGKPVSYMALSERLNNPLAIRAIASANGKNKLMIVIPCHRVIGSNGDLVGYAGGLWRKKWLLEHEVRMTGIGQTVLSL